MIHTQKKLLLIYDSNQLLQTPIIYQPFEVADTLSSLLDGVKTSLGKDVTLGAL